MLIAMNNFSATGHPYNFAICRFFSNIIQLLTFAKKTFIGFRFAFITLWLFAGNKGNRGNQNNNKNIFHGF